MACKTPCFKAFRHPPRKSLSIPSSRLGRKVGTLSLTLAARDAFLISASMQNDQIEFVEILSEKGGQCVLENPWPDKDATVYRNGKTAEGVSGRLLTLSTTAGERLALVPRGNVAVAKILQ